MTRKPIDSKETRFRNKTMISTEDKIEQINIELKRLNVDVSIDCDRGLEAQRTDDYKESVYISDSYIGDYYFIDQVIFILKHLNSSEASIENTNNILEKIKVSIYEGQHDINTFFEVYNKAESILLNQSNITKKKEISEKEKYRQEMSLYLDRIKSQIKECFTIDNQCCFPNIQPKKIITIRKPYDQYFSDLKLIYDRSGFIKIIAHVPPKNSAFSENIHMHFYKYDMEISYIKVHYTDNLQPRFKTTGEAKLIHKHIFRYGECMGETEEEIVETKRSNILGMKIAMSKFFDLKEKEYEKRKVIENRD